MSALVAVEAADIETRAGPPLWRRLLDAFFSPGRMGRAVADDPNGRARSSSCWR